MVSGRTQAIQTTFYCALKSYGELGDTKHAKLADTILELINSKFNAPGMKEEYKIAGALKIICQHFDEKKEAFCKRKEGLFPSPAKDAALFAEYLNNDLTHHHFSRLLALAIRAIPNYLDDNFWKKFLAEDKNNANTYHKFKNLLDIANKINPGEGEQYKKMITFLAPDLDKGCYDITGCSKKFIELEKTIQAKCSSANIKISTIDVYNLYTGNKQANDIPKLSKNKELSAAIDNLVEQSTKEQITPNRPRR